jgi:DNA-binding MarR family transcriptional regulator
MGSKIKSTKPPIGVPKVEPVSLALDALLNQSQEAMARLAADMKMNPNDVEALKHIMGAELTVIDLAGKLSVTSAAATQILDRLEARGHVRRIAHKDDGRKKVVVVSDSGQREVFMALLPMLESLNELARTFTSAEKKIITRYLKGATQALRKL